MADALPPNKWLLVQIGKDGMYHVFAFTSRKTAEHEEKRDEKYGVAALIVNLDDLFAQASGH